MSLSRAEIESIVAEIETVAGRSVVQRVLEVDRDTRVVQLREPGSTHYLLLSTKPQVTRIHFVEQRSEQPPKPTAFTMQLRRWLQGALFERVVQIQADRIVRLDFLAVDPAWEPESDGDGPAEDGSDDAGSDEDEQRAPRVSIALVVELTGRHPNWYLLDPEDAILGQLERESLGSRELGPGQRYQPPAPPPNPEVGARIRWSLDSLDAATFERSARVEAHFSSEIQERQFDDIHRSIGSRLRKRLKRLDRRIKHVEQDLARAEEASEYRRRGELLQSAWGRAERGSESVRVRDFYDESMPEVDIPLDPALNLKENIDHYFHEYHRLKGAREQIEERLLESMEQRDEVASAIDTLDEYGRTYAARDESDEQDQSLIDELEQLAKDLESAGVLKRERRQRRSSGGHEGGAAPRKPYREFRSYHDRVILVGRGASDNDKLSTSVARGRDMWFHARDWAGSHVVLRMGKNDTLKKEDLLDAATLAAWFSRGKNDTLVDVTYTRAKYVRKPKGFPPGRVTVADASTIGLAIEESRLKRLLANER
jgi:predicted ribosome quality control (RQC) complex YloA/Tae2 family protein